MGRIGHLAIMGALLSLAAIRPAGATTVAFAPQTINFVSTYGATLNIGSESITASCSASACANFELSQAGTGLAFTVSNPTGSLLSSTGAGADLTLSFVVQGPTSISNALFTFTETGATSTDAYLMVPSATPYDGNTQPLGNSLTPTVSSTSLTVIAAQEALSSSTTYLSITPDLLINSGTGTLAYTSITFGLNVPVPEPSSALLVLSALGVVGAGAMWGRRRAA